jgi:hypothetical protein
MFRRVVFALPLLLICYSATGRADQGTPFERESCLEEAVRLDAKSIDDARRALEEANIDELLGAGGGDEYVGLRPGDRHSGGHVPAL